MKFLDPENQCGQNLLRLSSRGSAIIAELLRLSTNIPEIFLEAEKVKDPDQKKYLVVIFDYQYLKAPEDYEKKINDNSDLLDLDLEFQENHLEILDRFYLLFESIYKYYLDIIKIIDDINSGYYLHHTLESILEETSGCQILCEIIYLYGVILIFLEEKIPGIIRERLVISHYRIHGEAMLENIDSIFKLCRNTGYVPAWYTSPDATSAAVSYGISSTSNYYNNSNSIASTSSTKDKKKNTLENFFSRFAIPKNLIQQVISTLQLNDIYLMSSSFPSPDHRSIRLSNQASMLYVILYMSPDTLKNNNNVMREIVDKYFHDNWILSIYMGYIIDLTYQWSNYPAAKAALDNVITTNSIKNLDDKNMKTILKSTEELKFYLKEGVLQQDYILDNVNNLLNTLREANSSLRWRLMHRKAKNESFSKIINSNKQITPNYIINYLLNISQYEFILKNIIEKLLKEKDIAWSDGKQGVTEKLLELSQFFAGDKLLTKVKRDENLMNWFKNLSDQANDLDLSTNHSTAVGRKIQSIIKALEDVEQFEVIDTNLQIKSFLKEIRDIFNLMIRTINIKDDLLNLIENISDLSYAWEILKDYIGVFHERIKSNPNTVVLLRATFLKMTSMLDIPLIRIVAINSPDAVSVANYYSTELIEFVRIVLEIIPISVFDILDKIVKIQTEKMTPIPIRIEAKELKEYAQLDVRCELTKLTHQVSIFTEGILVMEKTLLGDIHIEPRQILEEGLRREIVRLVSLALHKHLNFKDFSRNEINQKMTRVSSILDGIKRSIEYLQDYIAIPGLKIYQQEFYRIINYFTEQESNRFLKKKTYDSNSRYQSKDIPIPRLISIHSTNTLQTNGFFENNSLTFMGRVMNSILALTDPSITIYAPECSAWFLHTAPDQKQTSTVEHCGLRTFSLLEKSIGVIGLRGLDRLFCFNIVNNFNNFIKFYTNTVEKNHKKLFEEIFLNLTNETILQIDTHHNSNKRKNILNLYTTTTKKLEPIMLSLLKFCLKIGQIQLIRRQILSILKFNSQLDAHILHQTLDTFNVTLLNDIKKYNYFNVNGQVGTFAEGSPESVASYNYPDEETNPLLYETVSLLEACGLDEPLLKVYITTNPLENLSLVLFFFILSYINMLNYDENFSTLIRKKTKYYLDGVPFILGINCILKQFHISYTYKLLFYFGQFLKLNFEEIFLINLTENSSTSKNHEIMLKELMNCLIFLDQFCYYSMLPREVIHEFIPPYIFDSLKFSSSSSTK